MIDPSLATGLVPQLKKNEFHLLDKVYQIEGARQFSIVLSDYENVILQLTDFSGRIIYHEKVTCSNVVLPDEKLSNGIYFISAKKAGIIETRKIFQN